MENKLENINLKNKNGVVVVSSREVAENFGKRHDHVLRDIRNKIEVNPILGTPQYFIENKITNSQNNQEYTEYLMTRDGFSFLVMGFTGKKADEFKLKYIEAFNKMEEHINNRPNALPTNFKEALQQLLVEVEEKEQLQVEIKQLEPKAQFADAIATNEKSIDVGSMAKILFQNGIDVGRNRLFSILRENGFLMSSGDDTVPTQKSMNLGIMETKLGTYNVNGESKTYLKPMITTKGQVYFVGKFMKGELV